MSERLLQVKLLDAQARSSRISMLLPGSLVAAETELRCVCKAILATRASSRRSVHSVHRAANST